MNVFILNSGRCGSTTFIRACSHITNYSSAHESRLHLTGDARLAYPDAHIEADNRLSWYLGRLDDAFGDKAFYVHLKRDTADTASSFARRADFGIMQAYREGILLGGEPGQGAMDIALDYLDTVERNIAHFLADKTRKMTVELEQAKPQFPEFWQRIGAEGDLDAALREWDVAYNASEG
jgi:hypothetical protein